PHAAATFSRPPRPLRTTFFPYTTLFRSGYYGTHVFTPPEIGPVHLEFQVSHHVPERAFVVTALFSWHAPAADRETMHAKTPDEKDRKSTRLNSSHGSISYAVFCLKKHNA